MSGNQLRFNWIICLILVVFFLKDMFLTALFPIFKDQDESRHHNSIQFLNEPKEKTWEIVKKYSDEREKQDLSTYNYSKEIQKTTEMICSDMVRSPKDYENMVFPKNF